MLTIVSKLAVTKTHFKVSLGLSSFGIFSWHHQLSVVIDKSFVAESK